MEKTKKYFAFISYKREDEKWAKWLQHKLEHYRLPSNLNGRTDLPKEIRPIFRDQSDLSGGVLANEINQALDSSMYLIVVCSPRAAQSEWVGREVQSFIESGRSDKIIPFIIGGTAYSKDPSDECFPLAFRTLPPDRELLGVNINEMGRDAAAVKVAARMFNINFDVLWQRFEREQKRKRWLLIIAFILFLLICLGVGGYILKKNIELDKANEKLEYANANLANANLEITAQRDRANLERAKADSTNAMLQKANYEIDRKNKDLKAERDRANAERAKAVAANAMLTMANDSIRMQQDIIEQSNRDLVEINKQLEEERNNLEKANWEIYENNLRLIAEKAGSLADEGNSYLAQRLLLEVLPEDINNPDKPYIPEAEATLRKVAKNNCDAVIKLHSENFAGSISFSPDNKKVIYATEWNYYVRNCYNDSCMYITENNNYYYHPPCNSPDGNYILIQNDSGATIFNAKTFLPIGDIAINESVYSYYYGYHSIPIIDYVDSINKLKRFDYCDWFFSTYSPDGKKIFISNRGGTKVYDAETLNHLSNIRIYNWAALSKSSFSPDMQKIIYISRRFSINPLRLYTRAIVYDFNSSRKKVINNQDCYFAAFSPDGTKIFVALLNKIKLCDSQTLKYIDNIKIKGGKKYGIKWAEFSPEGRTIAIAHDSIVGIYDLSTRNLVKEYIGHTKPIISFAFNSDGSQIASTAMDQTIRIWDLTKQDQPQISNADYSNNSTDITPRLDIGNEIISVNEDEKGFVIVSKESKDTVAKKYFDDKIVEDITYSPNGEYIACVLRNAGIYVTGYNETDGKIWLCVYDTKKYGRVMYELIPSLYVDRSMESAGSKVYIGFDKSSVIVYVDDKKYTYEFLPFQDLINKTRERFKEYPLTPEERKKYYLE